MSDNKKLSPSILLNVILFGFMGQVAWAVENNFFNLYMLKIGGDMHDISIMIAVSAIVAFLTTLFMGSLSDKINKRKVFICAGYILWGLTVIAFAIINPETVAKLIKTGTTRFFLGHLSRENDLPQLAYQTSVCALSMEGAVEGDDYLIRVAKPVWDEKAMIL
jgi:MFS family permease